MANDHYMPRFLTRPWEHGQRVLRYFDFVSETFGDKSSKRLFAKSDLNSPGVEVLFNQAIETPMANLKQEMARSGGLLPISDTDWKTRRAVALLMFLNPMRIASAGAVTGLTTEKPGLTAASIDAGGLPLLDRVAGYFLQRFHVMAVEVPEDRSFCFPDVGGFALPFAGKPSIAMPIGLRHVLLSREQPFDRGEIHAFMDSGMLTAFSLGVGERGRRVVLPPAWRERSVEDAQAARRELLGIRKDLQRLFNQIGKANLSAGLEAWQVNPRSG